MVKNAKKKRESKTEETGGTSENATGGKDDHKTSRRNFFKCLCCWTTSGSDEVVEPYNTSFNASTEEMFDIEFLPTQASIDTKLVDTYDIIPKGTFVEKVEEETVEHFIKTRETGITGLVPYIYERASLFETLGFETANLHSSYVLINPWPLCTNLSDHLTAQTRWLQDVALHDAVPQDTCIDGVPKRANGVFLKEFPINNSKNAIVPYTYGRDRRIDLLYCQHANLKSAYVSIDLWKFCNHVIENLHFYRMSLTQKENKVLVFLYNIINKQKILLSLSKRAFHFLQSIYFWVKGGQPQRQHGKDNWPVTKVAPMKEVQSSLSFSSECYKPIHAFLHAFQSFHLQGQDSSFIPEMKDICIDLHWSGSQQLLPPILQLAQDASLQNVSACGWFSHISPLTLKREGKVRPNLQYSHLSPHTSRMLITLPGQINQLMGCLNAAVSNVKIDVGRIKMQKDLPTFLFSNAAKVRKLFVDKVSLGSLEMRVDDELEKKDKSNTEKEICRRTTQEIRKTKLGFCLADAEIADINDPGKPSFLVTDETSFQVFGDEYKRIVQEWHSTFDGSNVVFGGTNEAIKAVKATTYERLNSWWAVESSVSLFRSFKRFAFGPFIQTEDRKTIGYIMESIADLVGCEYIKVSTKNKEEKDLLRNFSIQLGKPVSVEPEKWPGERAVLVLKEVTNTKRLIVKVNFEEHLEICCIANDGALKKATLEALKMEQLIKEKLNDMNFAFSKHDVFGYCNSNLMHIGMASVIKIQLYIPELYQHGIFNDLLKHHGLRKSYFGRKKGRSFKIVELESTVQFGTCEIDHLNAMYNAASQLIEIERRLECRKDIRSLLPAPLKFTYDQIKTAEAEDEAALRERDATQGGRPNKENDMARCSSKKKSRAKKHQTTKSQAATRSSYSDTNNSGNKARDDGVKKGVHRDQEPVATYQSNDERYFSNRSSEQRHGIREGTNGDVNRDNGCYRVVGRADDASHWERDFYGNYSHYLRRARPNSTYAYGYPSHVLHHGGLRENRQHGNSYRNNISDIGDLRPPSGYLNYAQFALQSSSFDTGYHLQTAHYDYSYLQDVVQY